ncbi:hypothetical protein [Cystobacter ferrugineus]|uniref:Uncharacterized protein n=1 Tax=Cystobacter ferrugineus TaxID=83449 RepID=A0A1L9BGK0_9BACT|nr:hypothetical protein [Cystobacter ferrugineus]OJH41380.1 hypothetical protein BON30_10990 [Cystobacter ferrugineus]
MSDIIDPKGSAPVNPRSNVFVDQTRGQEQVEGSEVRAAAYGCLDDGPVLVRSTNPPMKHRGLTIGTLTMVTVSLITFWMPGLGSLMAGVFGGFFAKRWKRSFIAAALASVAVPLILRFLDIMRPEQGLHDLYGIGMVNWTIVHIVSLFIGTAIGVYSCPLVERSGGLRQELPE